MADYNRMSPAMDELYEQLLEYSKISYGRRAYELSRNEAERLVEAINALRGLLNDTQHVDHDCGDPRCPVDIARKALK